MAQKIVKLKDYLHLLYELANIPTSSFANKILKTLSRPKKMLEGFVHQFDEECKLWKEEQMWIDQKIEEGMPPEEIIQAFKRLRKREYAQKYVKEALLSKTLTPQEMIPVQNIGIPNKEEQTIEKTLFAGQASEKIVPILNDHLEREMSSEHIEKVQKKL